MFAFRYYFAVVLFSIVHGLTINNNIQSTMTKAGDERENIQTIDTTAAVMSQGSRRGAFINPMHDTTGSPTIERQPNEGKMEIITININGHNQEMKVNTSLTLQDLRTLLQNQMHKQDKFSIALNDSNNELSIYQQEDQFKISELQRNSLGKIVLYIGQSRQQIENIAYEFLRGMRHTGDKWELGVVRVADFASNYMPEYSIPYNAILFESNFTLSRSSYERFIEGVNEYGASVGAPFVTAEFKHEHSSTGQHSSSTEMVYSFARLLNRKQEVKIDASKLKPTNEFINEIDSIMNKNNYYAPIERAKDLVRTLNKFGWIMPVHYVLGGAFRESIIEQKQSNTNLDKHSKSLEASLKASFAVYSAGANFNNRNTESTSLLHGNEMRSVKKSSVGANGAIEIDSYIQNVADKRNWQIIQYFEFCNTLSLLKNVDNWTFIETIKLLRNFYYKKEIQKLQRHIDIFKYIQTLTSEVHNPPF